MDTSDVKTSFEVNEAFTYEGLVVTAYYNNGGSSAVTPTDVSEPDMTTEGSKTVTVTYNGLTETYTINVSEPGSGGTVDFTLDSASSVTKEGITITFAKGSGSNAPAWYSAGLRLYASNTVTVTVTGSLRITEITFNWEKQSDKAFATCTADVGTYDHPSAAGDGVWSGSEQTIVFTLGGSGQLQLNTFSVTYA